MGKTKPLIEGGYYIKARCIQNSEIAHCPPHFREIWDWLIKEANHKDRKVSGKIIKRGQLFTSYQEIRNGLRWKIGYRTERYSKWQCENAMKFLRKAVMVATAKTARGVIITILNYDIYQNPENYESRNESRNESRGLPQPPDTKNKNGKNVKKEKKIYKRKIPDVFPLTNELKEYALKKGIFKNEVEGLFERFKKSHGSKGTVMLKWDMAWQTWVLNEIKWNPEKYAERKEFNQESIEEQCS